MGPLARINRLQVAIIGIVLSILAAAGIYIGLVKPQQDLQAEADARLAAAEEKFSKIPAAETDLAKAKAEVATAKRKWVVYDRRFMPDINISNLFTGTRQLWNEQINVLGPKTVRFLNADRTVRVVSQAVTIPAPSGDPNAVNRKAFVYPLGSVTVAGTFDQVLRHAERWNNFDRLVLVEGLALQGNSPRLQGTYTLTCYEFTRGETPGPAVPQAAAGAGGGFGGGGFPGGPPGGFPGGPPPGFEGGGPPPGFEGGPEGAGPPVQ